MVHLQTCSGLPSYEQYVFTRGPPVALQVTISALGPSSHSFFEQFNNVGVGPVGAPGNENMETI